MIQLLTNYDRRCTVAFYYLANQYFSISQVVLCICIQNNILTYNMEELKHAIEAMAVIDIDPTFTLFFQQQQKWLTSIQLTTQPPRDRQNTKYFAIIPGVFLLLSFCEKNKDPIYQVQFNQKPGSDWIIVKSTENINSLIGAYFCFKTEPNLMSGPICDIDILSIQRKSRYGESKEILNVPHSYKLISHQLSFGYLIFRKIKSKIQQSFKAVLAQKYISAKASRINLSQLPLFCFPEGIKIVREIRGFLTFNFILTLETGQRIYATCLIFKQPLDEAKRQKLQVLQTSQLFYQKALCIISNKCYTDQFAECLQHLYRLSMSKSEVPFWKVAQTLVNQMIMPQNPQLGEIGLSYMYGGIKINFSTNFRYPFISQRALYSIFKFMSIENIISVFESLLLERKVIFVSQSKTILGYATEAFLGLLYPFKWQQVLIPILPLNLKQFLTAPVPLVVGINPSLVDSSIETDSVIVYLDKNQVLNGQDNPPLPDKLFKQLMKRLQKFQIYDPAQVTQFLQNPQSTYLFKMQQVQDPHFHGHLIRDIFLQFLLTLMKNYKKFLIKTNNYKQNEEASMMSMDEPALMSNIFKIQDFLSDLGMTKIGSFGYKFTESSIFTSFIQRKFQHPNQPQLHFFDQCIQRKKSKKQASFIVLVQNKQYRIIKNAEVSPDDPGPFFYQQFPSLLKQSIIKQQQVQIKILDQKQQESKIISSIQQQYHLNHDFYQSVECQDQPQKKMLSLLLNKNKSKFQAEKMERFQKLNWFLGFYQKQSYEIQSILSQWPGVICQQDFIRLKKYQYLKTFKKPNKNSIIGVFQGEDCQILLRDQTKILFVGHGHNNSITHRSSAIIIQVLSYRIKQLINRIVIKQAGLLIDFCQKQAAKDLRASSLKKASQQTWNIQTIINFKQWLHYQKQFGTGMTND